MSLEESKAAKRTEVDNQHDTRRFADVVMTMTTYLGGVPLENVPFRADQIGRNAVKGGYLVISRSDDTAGGIYNLDIRASNGSVYGFYATDFKVVDVAIGARDLELFMQWTALHAQIDAATTEPEVEAIAWPT